MWLISYKTYALCSTNKTHPKHNFDSEISLSCDKPDGSLDNNAVHCQAGCLPALADEALLTQDYGAVRLYYAVISDKTRPWLYFKDISGSACKENISKNAKNS